MVVIKIHGDMGLFLCLKRGFVMIETFYDFCEEAEQSLKDYIPKEYQECTVSLHRPESEMDFEHTYILVLPPGTDMAPIIRPAEYYEDVQSGETTIDNAILLMVRDVTEKLDQLMHRFGRQPMGNWNQDRQRVYMTAVPVKGNSQLLTKVPFRKQGDVAFVYKIDQYTYDINGNTKVRNTYVTNEMMKQYEVSEQELYVTASQNIMEKYVPYLGDLNRINAIMAREDLSREEKWGYIAQLPNLINQPEKISEGSRKRAVLTCLEKPEIGSAMMALPGMLEKISEIIGGNMYVMPDTTREVEFLERKLFDNPYHIQEEHVENVKNKDTVGIYLTDQLHLYDPKTCKIKTIDERNEEIVRKAASMMKPKPSRRR